MDYRQAWRDAAMALDLARQTRQARQESSRLQAEAAKAEAARLRLPRLRLPRLRLPRLRPRTAFDCCDDVGEYDGNDPVRLPLGGHGARARISSGVYPVRLPLLGRERVDEDVGRR